jgi:hypothetical protein
MKRNIVINVLAPDKDTHRKVVDSIRLYQAACRKAYSVCATVEMAGAEINTVDKEGNPKISVKPLNDRSKQIIELAIGMSGKKGHFYELRPWLQELHPSWMYLVPEAIQRNIVSKRWRAKDPEFPEAKRGYLTLNGAREFARFTRIGIYFKNTAQKIGERSITLKWDYDIGEVTFKIYDMDPSRWYIWKNVCSGAEGWSNDTMYLQEKDGKLRIVAGYTCPDKEQVLDQSKPLYVEFGTDPKLYITMRSDKIYDGDVLSVIGALEWAKEIEAISSKFSLRKDSYGSLNKKWGGRRGWRAVIKKINRLTDRRTNGVMNHNHLWTRRIANAAVRYGAGRIIVLNMPEKSMFGIPWAWHNFRTMLEYKVGEIGGKVEYAEVPKLSEALAA